jgi:hypothetical protein
MLKKTGPLRAPGTLELTPTALNIDLIPGCEPLAYSRASSTRYQLDPIGFAEQNDPFAEPLLVCKNSVRNGGGRLKGTRQTVLTCRLVPRARAVRTVALLDLVYLRRAESRPLSYMCDDQEQTP